MSEIERSYQLKRPFRFAGKGMITELALRRATAADLRAAEQARGPIAQAMVIMARLSGLKLAAIEKIDSDDFAAIAELLGIENGVRVTE